MSDKYSCNNCANQKTNECDTCVAAFLKDGSVGNPSNFAFKSDIINNPSHYTAGGIETIDFIQAKLTPEQFKGHLMANILKYVTRHQHKNGVEDLKKARWYLDKLIEAGNG